MNFSHNEDEAGESRSLVGQIPMVGTPYVSGWPVFTIRSPWAVTSLPQEGNTHPEDTVSDVIFTPEAAKLLRATESRTRYLARTGVIPAFKVGKKEWRYSRKALEEWVLMQAKGSLNALGSLLAHSSRPEPSVKPKAAKRRRNIPTDLSPEALRKAIQSIRPAGE